MVGRFSGGGGGGGNGAELALVRLDVLLQRGDELVHRLRRDDDAGADLEGAHVAEHEVDDEFLGAVLDDLPGGVNAARDLFGDACGEMAGLFFFVRRRRRRRRCRRRRQSCRCRCRD